MWIDKHRHTRIGTAHHPTPVLNSPERRNIRVLIRRCRAPIPPIIRNHHQKLGTLNHHIARKPGKHRIKTNHPGKLATRHLKNRKRSPTLKIAADIPSAAPLKIAQKTEQLGKRCPLSKRHHLHLVVMRQIAPARLKQKRRIVIAIPRRGLKAIRPHIQINTQRIDQRLHPRLIRLMRRTFTFQTRWQSRL